MARLTRLLSFLALGIVLFRLVQRKLLEEPKNPLLEAGPLDQSDPLDRLAAEVSDAVARSETPVTSAPAAAPAQTANGNDLRRLTKAELYREAQELRIPGRSSMTKAQLEGAIAVARAAH